MVTHITQGPLCKFIKNEQYLKIESINSGELKEIEMCSASWSSWLKYSHYTIMFSVAFFFIPITILLITNCLICKRIWSSGNTNINGSWKSIQNVD